jgi:hypothetical protein
MKTLKLIVIAVLMIFTNQLSAQSIAVGPINTFKVYAFPSTAAKLVRLELVKLDKYSVLDEFDMNEVDDPGKYESCFSKTCLFEYGDELNVDLMMSGNIDKIGNKIVITLKLIDIRTKEVVKTATQEFTDNESELQRMIGIVIQKMHGINPDPELFKRLVFQDEVITSTNVGRVNNSGPRMGIGFAYGELQRFMIRPEYQGGMGMVPVVSNLGYQFEAQYVGTENFSALFEFLPTINGLEQGKFLPSLSIMNGFRFGQAGWEFAFGPSFGLTRTSQGFFDHHGLIDDSQYGRYWTANDLRNEGHDFSTSEIEGLGYSFKSNLDSRGDVKISTKWVMAVGRTFSSGALNVPVNIFYSSQKEGGLVGMSVGFNITRSKDVINK